MIDTLAVGYEGMPVGPPELAEFRRHCVGNIDISGVQGECEAEGRMVRWSGNIPGLGRLTLNADGFVRHERSLVKTYQALILGLDDKQLSNVQMLSTDDCNRTFVALTEKLESMLPFINSDSLRVNRADIVYQRRVRSSYQTIQALKGAVKPTRGGVAWFDNAKGVPTGIMFRGDAVAHRAYDKGLESLDLNFVNVLRSEEQLRTRAVALGRVVDVANRRFDPDACRDVLNERYLDVAYGGELDVSSLVNEGKDTQALLVLHPELLPLYKARVKRAGYYKMMKQVRQARASAVPDELRVPEDAWRR